MTDTALETTRALGRQLIDEFGKGWSRAKIDQMMAVFASDAVFVETPFKVAGGCIGKDQRVRGERLHESTRVELMVRYFFSTDCQGRLELQSQCRPIDDSLALMLPVEPVDDLARLPNPDELPKVASYPQGQLRHRLLALRSPQFRTRRFDWYFRISLFP